MGELARQIGVEPPGLLRVGKVAGRLVGEALGDRVECQQQYVQFILRVRERCILRADRP